MNSKLHAKVLTMAAATLGLSLMGGCAKKAAPAEGGQAASGAEASCGAGSCNAAHGKKPLVEADSDAEGPNSPAPAELNPASP